MRFIYETNFQKWYEKKIVPCEWISFWHKITIEDLQDNIIWLISDEKSYEEMREYYEI